MKNVVNLQIVSTILKETWILKSKERINKDWIIELEF